MFVIGSTISPLIVISICMMSYNLGAPRRAAVRLGAGCPRRCAARALDADRHQPADPRRRPRQIDDDVLRRPAGDLGVAPPARGVHQHLDLVPDQLARSTRSESSAAAPAARRCAASSRASLTSSGSRLSASVFGRGEYLNENMLWNRTAAVSDSVSSKSASVSPGKPTIISVDSATSGSDSRICATSSR